MKNYIYATLELYDQQNGIKGGGGLGVLAADMRRAATEAKAPLTLLTPFYPWEVHQRYQDGVFSDYHVQIFPAEYGYERLGEVVVALQPEQIIHLEVWQKMLGAARILTIFEPDFGELYSSDGSGDHRLYQEVALGFGGWQALRYAEVEPQVLQLNETATFFCALAWLDELVTAGFDLYEAIVYLRRHTLYTNHTLVQAAESEFSAEQFVRFVLPNLQNRAVARWLMNQFVGGKAKLSGLTLELAGKRSGVSKLHARVADYTDLNGDKVAFIPVTNGVDFDQWVMPEVLEKLVAGGALDKTGAPTDDYAVAIPAILTPEMITSCKSAGRQRLLRLLDERYQIQPDENGIWFNFKRRFVDYKRPWLAFSDPARLAQLLEDCNGYYFLAGKVHTGDMAMLDQLERLLKTVAENEILARRVFYLADYDEAVAAALTAGCDVSINNPIVGLEACGTSWEKDIANLGILISTNDGGVADIEPAHYLEIHGADEPAEIQSLYQNIERAIKLCQDPALRAQFLQRQLIGYLPTLSAGRMLKEYFRLMKFPPKE